MQLRNVSMTKVFLTAALVTILATGSALASLGTVPTCRRIVAERFFDESGGMQLVLHSPFGGGVNRALGLALRKNFCVTFDFELHHFAGLEAAGQIHLVHLAHGLANPRVAFAIFLSQLLGVWEDFDVNQVTRLTCKGHALYVQFV